ncbi:hypothetical protein D3C78_1415660 [compost metagenome]
MIKGACLCIAPEAAQAAEQHAAAHLFEKTVFQRPAGEGFEQRKAARNVVALQGDGRLQQGQLGLPLHGLRNTLQRGDPGLGLVRQQRQRTAPDAQ